MSQNRTKRDRPRQPSKTAQKPYWVASQNAASKLIGYMRVSKSDQSTDQQLDALRKAGCHAIYADQGVSGADRDRQNLAAALHALRPGDTLVVVALDRLARDLEHLLAIAAELREDGCNLRSLREGIDTTTATGKLVYSVFGAIAEFERALAIERTRERLAAKKRRGERVGRKPKMTIHDVIEARKMLSEGKSSVYVAQRFRVGRATLYRHLAE